jgi:hypothetical protein
MTPDPAQELVAALFLMASVVAFSIALYYLAMAFSPPPKP